MPIHNELLLFLLISGGYYEGKGGEVMKYQLTFRKAEKNDLDPIVEMLADDALGKGRERYIHPLPESYMQAFQAIDADPNNELIVVCRETEIIGVMQMTFTPYLTHQGSWRATIEGVRTSSVVRGQGTGTQMIKWAIERAKERGCSLVQLTTDKQRAEALRFYQKLGFSATHEGMKMKL
jgi:GNAT superfamily N-acetyltransferase